MGGDGMECARERSGGGGPIGGCAVAELDAVLRWTVELVEDVVGADVNHIGGRIIVRWPLATELIGRV